MTFSLDPLARKLFDESRVAHFLVDPDAGTILTMNPAAERLAGRSQAVLRGTEIFQLIAADEEDAAASLRHATRQRAEFAAREGFYLVPLEGERLPVSVAVAPIAAVPSPFALVMVREAGEPIQKLLYASPLAIYTIDFDGIVRTWNPACERIFGWTAAEVLGKPLPTIPDDRRAEVEDLVHRIRSGESFTARVCERVGKGGAPVIVAISAAPLHDAQGKVNAILALVDDVSGRRRLEESLQTQAHILESLAEGVTVSDDRQRIRYVNPAFEAMFGYGPGELLGHHVSILNNMPPEENQRFVQSVVATVFAGQVWSGEIPNRRKDGSHFVTETRVSMLEVAGERYWVSVQADVTDRKRATEALRQAEEKYHRIFDHAVEGIYQTAPDGRFLTANPMLARIWGYASADEMLADQGGPKQFNYVLPGRRQEFIDQTLAHGSVAAFESQVRRNDGSVIWISENARVVRDAGKVLYFEGTAVDVTQRKRAEEELARQHALLHSLLNSIPDLIALKDASGQYQRCNTAFERYLGRPEEEIVGRTDLELFPPDVGEKRQESDRLALTGHKVLRSEEWLEYPDGTRVLVDELKTTFFSPSGELLGILVIQRDVTERRQLEEQLRQSQKMEAIGKLAAGIAHDFNNRLTVILGNVSLLQGGTVDAESTRELLTSVERAGWSAADLVRQLLGFSRQTILRKQPINLNQIVNEIAGILRRTVDPSIYLAVVAAPDLRQVLADPGQMNQVLMNLCLNAREAMPGGGTLLIETASVELREGSLSGHARPGDFVRLRISDTGVGIPDEVRPHVFEPFFTTKPFGKGTGLGLAVVFGIVQQHEGWVDVHSEVGRGSRFDVYLPRLAQQSSEVQPLFAPALPTRKPATILIVDDEAMIRDLGQTWLESLGYRVLLAAHGREALDLIQNQGERPDLVLLDMKMPEMPGREVFRRLREIDPHLPVLFSSGYSDDPPELDHASGYIAKPYQVQDLAKAVGDLLEAAARAGDRPEDGGTTSSLHVV